MSETAVPTGVTGVLNASGKATKPGRVPRVVARVFLNLVISAKTRKLSLNAESYGGSAGGLILHPPTWRPPNHLTT